MDVLRCRSGKHEIRKPTDRRSNGTCAACARDNERRYRERRNAQLVSHELAQMRSIAVQLANRDHHGDSRIAEALHKIADAFTSRLHPID